MGFTSINFSRLIHIGDREEHDPYIEASQAQMVYYVNDELNKDWSVVVHLKPRDLYDMGEQGDIEICENMPYLEQDLDHFFGDTDDLPLLREDLDDELLSEGNANEVEEDEHMSKRIRNPLKSVDGSSSHAPTSVDAFVQPNLTPNDPVQTPPRSPHVDNEVSQQPNQSLSQPSQSDTQSSKHRVGHEEHDTIEELKMKVKDIHNLRDGLRIIVEFDEYFLPIGETAGLLAGVCGEMATNSLFSLSFEKWSDMPDTFFDNQWHTLFNPRFCFKVNEDMAKRHLRKSIGKKWREYRIKLWNAFDDPTMSKNEIIKNVPEDISMDQWALFVEYRSKTTTKDLCKRNKEVRKKQTIPHTCGAKSLARRRHELKIETGKTIGRGPMWNMTHKRKDRSYVNDEAREIGEKIDNHLSQSVEASSEISPNDAVGVVFGKEHPGRVRGLGLGAVPTIAFKHTTTRISGMNFGLSSANTSSLDLQQKVVTMESQLQALCAYISAKEGGSIPPELAGFFHNSTQQAPDIGSGAPSPNNLRRSASGSNTHSADHSRPPNDI
ncbi:putative transposase, Ptta/En/Spm, plant [Sesbania bispinosa]|nr:putative transposase, Ptta/En/Spm, plant [Sesbania bispinosa]